MQRLYLIQMAGERRIAYARFTFCYIQIPQHVKTGSRFGNMFRDVLKNKYLTVSYFFLEHPLMDFRFLPYYLIAQIGVSTSLKYFMS